MTRYYLQPKIEKILQLMVEEGMLMNEQQVIDIAMFEWCKRNGLLDGFLEEEK